MEIRCHSGACLFRWFDRSRDDPYMGSEEVSVRDQHQNPQSGGRNKNLPDAAAPHPPLTGSARVAYNVLDTLQLAERRGATGIFVAD